MIRLTLTTFPTLLRRLATQTERMSKRRTEASSSVPFQPASKRQRFTANAVTLPEDVEVRLIIFDTGRGTFTFSVRIVKRHGGSACARCHQHAWHRQSYQSSAAAGMDQQLRTLCAARYLKSPSRCRWRPLLEAALASYRMQSLQLLDRIWSILMLSGRSSLRRAEVCLSFGHLDSRGASACLNCYSDWLIFSYLYGLACIQAIRCA